MRMFTTLTALALVLTGCTLIQGKKIDYKSASSLPPLEAPPDLIVPAADNRYAIPGSTATGSATYSGYSQERGDKSAAGNAAVLPKIDKARIERAGSQRWLVVDIPAKTLWPLLKDFWQEMGFIVNLERPETGIMETDWAENRAKIPQDSLRGFLSKALDAVYSTAERDKFRTRIEPAANGQGTEVYISHRGMYEVFEGTQGGGDQGQGRTIWQPRPADPELEAEMLHRLLTRLGVEEGRANTLLANAGSEPRARLGKAADGAPALSLPEPFDRAWRRVGLALDRIGFAVEDRDRAGGLYYVRYADPDAKTAREKAGFLAKLAFWRSKDGKPAAAKYRIRVSGQGEASEVAVYLENGSPASDDTGARISTLLFEQLK